MNNENMKLWHSVFKTDPNAVKPIEGKTYKGNSPKPYWLIEQATKHFGACGIGWGVEVVNQSYQQVSPDDWLHTATVRVWYILDGKRGVIEQCGGTKAAYKTKSGSHVVDDDAAKKSVTDGMTKCFSMIGFAGDIFSGRWDDSKYVEQIRTEFEDEKRQEQGFISKQQEYNLVALAQEVGADLNKFCTFLNIKHLSKLPLAAYDNAVKSLEQKRKAA